MFNPKLKDFMKNNPEQTILGFTWSCYWRLYLVIVGIAFIIAILAEIY